MYKKIFFSVLFILAITIPVYGQSFRVLLVEENLEEVVIVDRDTGNQWVARVGDEIEGWKIVKIDFDHVTIAKRGDSQVFVTEIPVSQGGDLIMMTPK